jgi:hypothetical protein
MKHKILPRVVSFQAANLNFRQVKKNSLTTDTFPGYSGDQATFGSNCAY